MPSKLIPKKIKARVKLLKAIPYKDCMVYIRMIDNEIFMYDLIYKNELYSSYLVITPKKGSKKLTKDEINQSAALIFSGAISTIDILVGNKLDKKTKNIVNTFEKNRETFEKNISN